MERVPSRSLASREELALYLCKLHNQVNSFLGTHGASRASSCGGTEPGRPLLALQTKSSFRVTWLPWTSGGSQVTVSAGKRRPRARGPASGRRARLRWTVRGAVRRDKNAFRQGGDYDPPLDADPLDCPSSEASPDWPSGVK